MEFGSSETEAIYGGHISGRRLRGVKINPIYQENDNGRHGEGGDTQSDGSIPVGEIQIEMYESLPRHQQFRPYNSDPSLQHTGPAGLSNVPYVYNGQEAYYGESGEGEESLHFSDFSLPRASRVMDAQVDQNDQTLTLRDGPTDGGEEGDDDLRPWSWPQSKRGSRKQLTRQSRLDVASEDPDVIATAENSPCASSHTSPSSSSHSSPSAKYSRNRRVVSKTGKLSPFHRHRNLSVVREQPSMVEREEIFDECEEGDAEHGEENGDDDDVIVPNLDHDNDDDNDQKDHVQSEASEENQSNKETCHVMCVTGGKEDMQKDLYSGQNCEKNLVNDFYNRTSFIIDIESPNKSPNNKNGLLPRSKAMYSLEKIAMLPSYSDIHHTSPVSSVDYFNNNNETVPDLMLQHNGRLNGISRLSPLNGIKYQDTGLNGEEYSMWDAHSLKVFYSLSNSSSVDSESKQANKETPFGLCDCEGKPTLKCACGRLALQRLLREKHMIKDSEDDWFTYASKSVSEETGSTKSVKSPSKHINGKIEILPNGNISHHPMYSANNSPSHDPDSPFQKPIQEPLRPILHGCASSKRNVPSIECRMVTFAKGTIFNEEKRIKYVKECITPSDLTSLVSDLQDEEGGVDNPVFADWEEDGSLTDDDKVKRKASFKHPSAVNKIVSDDSIVLQVSDLNAPEYMQTYLKGLHGCNVIRSSLADGEKRAAPVSIEAIGGITTDDPSFDVIGEAAEEEFEYYRRRRKYQDGDDEDVDKWLKKMNRCKKIKICFIIILIIVLVITGIALAIHYGAPNAGSMLGSAGSSQSSESNSVERFSPIF